MMYNDKLLLHLNEKYTLCQIDCNHDRYFLFSIGKESNKNYIILKRDICSEGELRNVTEFIDRLSENRFTNASFIFVAFVKNNFKDDEYFLFNGKSFLHTITYNLETAQFAYDKNFHYEGGKKIKQLFADIEQIIF